MKKIIVCIIMFLFLYVGLIAKPTMYPIKWVKYENVIITVFCIDGKTFLLTKPNFNSYGDTIPTLIQVMDKGGAVKCGGEK